ncbi:24498_t:CDS:2, partial [Gigaspora rosea]
LKVYLHFNKQTDKRCYNLPTANEIAIILPGNFSISETMRDIILRLQFIVDAWAATEQNRLRFLHLNQDILRADAYQGLTD